MNKTFICIFSVLFPLRYYTWVFNRKSSAYFSTQTFLRIFILGWNIVPLFVSWLFFIKEFSSVISFMYLFCLDAKWYLCPNYGFSLVGTCRLQGFTVYRNRTIGCTWIGKWDRIYKNWLRQSGGLGNPMICPFQCAEPKRLVMCLPKVSDGQKPRVQLSARR